MGEEETKTDDVKAPEAEAKPSPDELSALKARLKATEDELEVTKKSLQGTRGSLQEKDRLLKEQSSLRDEVNTIRETMKILAAEIADKEGLTEEATPERKQSLLKKFDELEEKRKKQEEEAKRKEAYDKLVQQTAEYQKRVEALGLKEEDDAYWEIYDLVTSGNPTKIKRADIKISKLEKEKSVAKETKEAEGAKPKEDEAQKKIAELEAEIRKLKGGGLESETGLPAGQAKTFEDIEKGYISGKVSYADYAEARRKKGL